MTDRPVSNVYVAETSARQVIALAAEGRTAQVRIHRTRPVRVFELEARRGFLAGGSLLLPEQERGRSGLAPLGQALERVRERPAEKLLVAGHAADPALAARRAEVVRALLTGDRDAFATLAQAHGSVKDWQELLGWTARTRGIDCDPQGADGKVGPNTRGALARFREARGLPPGDPDGPGDADWRAFAELLDEELAAQARTDAAGLAKRRAGLQLVAAGALGCAACWPVKSVAIVEHATLADERVDLCLFAPGDVPRLECHAGPEPVAAKCDLYRKGKYRCAVCRPAEPVRGFVCFEVEGLRFDFDRSLVRPEAFPVLADVAGLLADDPKLQATLYGHTDTVGDEAYNKLLSERRARAVLAVLTHDLEAWEAVWTAERWDGAVAAEVAAAVSPAAAAAGPQALATFQREAGLREGPADAETRRALGDAYFRLAVAEPVAADRFLEHRGGQRFMGCGELNPIGDGLDERSRRVVVLVFDPDRAPRDLPCALGDLAPCKASCRTAPPGTEPPGDRAGFQCAVFRRLAATCACGQRPTPRVITFRYGLEAAAFGAAASVVLVNEQGAEVALPLAAGAAEGDHRVLDFQVERDLRYRGELREADGRVVPLFGPSLLHDLSSDEGPTEHLAPPEREPAAPSTPLEVEDHGRLRVRLHDASGEVLATRFRLHLGGQVLDGYAEDGWAAALLPPACPSSCTIEWGEPDGRGRFPFHAEVALDCHGPDSLSSMLHNLGYPKRLPLDTRVRAFQKAEHLKELGLTPKGEVPPLTKARIEAVYEARRRET